MPTTIHPARVRKPNRRRGALATLPPRAEWPVSLNDPARAAAWLAELQEAAALRGLTEVLEASR